MPTNPIGSTAGKIPLPVVRLDATGGGSGRTANIQLKIGGEPVSLEIAVPDRPAALREMLPVFQGLTDVVVGVAVREVERQGQQVSCRAGCGACCRQPVPVSESEARSLRRLVDGLPEPRRSQVRQRFADVLRRLTEAGLLEQLQQRIDQQFPADSPPVRKLGLAYFALGIACPFLENESCSIHPDRPIACREYLVTTPAENCSRPTAETIRMVPLPAKIGVAVRELDKHACTGGWVPLILALEWADAHPESPPQPGPKWLEDFFKMWRK
jgi:Fe-S-cluster containining protein